MYYYSDVISSKVPALGKLITDNILELLVFPLLLTCLRRQNSGVEIGIHSSLYLLCNMLRIIKTRDLASAIAASLFYPPEAFVPKTEATPNGSDIIQQSEAGPNDYCHELSNFQGYQQSEPCSLEMQEDNGSSLLSPPGSSQNDSPCYLNSQSNSFRSHISLRELLLSYVVSGDDFLVLGSLSLLATLLQTKELDESILDGLGILPQRQQHKRLLLQALVGEGSGEEQLFSSIHTELDGYLQKLGDQYGQLYCCGDLGVSPQKHRSQVLNALVGLFCRGDLSADTMWTGGWLLRQLLPNGEEGFTNNHLIQLKDSNKYSTAKLVEEIKGSWCDMLIAAVMDEWRNCKRAIEAASPHQDPKSILMSSRFCPSEGESCISAGERMCEMVKIFVLQRQLLIFSSGGFLPDHLPVQSPKDSLEHFRAKTAGVDVLDPKHGSEINLEYALPCTIAFRRGKEHHLYFLAISWRTSGWILLAEQLPLKQQRGVVRIFHPLAGSEPRIDEKCPKWLHLRIRPSNLPSRDLSKYDAFGKGKPKVLVDGRWILAFKDEEACKSAESMLVEEMHLQHREVEKRMKPFLELDPHGHTTGPSCEAVQFTNNLL